MPKSAEDTHREDRSSRATLNDVARVAGVAPITVSRALRNPQSVASKTRAKIEEAVEKVNYIPNMVAGSLASNRTRTIAFIVPTLANSIFTEVLLGIHEVMAPRNYQVIVGNSNYSLQEEEKLVGTFLGRQVDGLVLTGGIHTKRTKEMLHKHQVAVVETWSMPENPIDLSVGFSNFEAARQMTAYLYEQGRRTIGFVSAPTADNDRSRSRLDGCRAALEELGGNVSDSLILESAFGLRHGSYALNTLMQRQPNIDAIFFANDTLAVGGLLECQRRSISVPDQMAIAGFDNLEIASEIMPRLTTVGVFRRDMGQKAAEMLLKRINNESIEHKKLDLGFQIIKRSSA